MTIEMGQIVTIIYPTNGATVERAVDQITEEHFFAGGTKFWWHGIEDLGGGGHWTALYVENIYINRLSNLGKTS